MKKDYSNEQARKNYLELLENPSKIPMHFVYDGKEYSGFGGDSFKLTGCEKEKNGEKETTTFFYEFNDELTVSLTLNYYNDFGATEWWVWFENKKDKESKVLERIETKLAFSGNYPVLKGIFGDHVNQYRPYSIPLEKNRVDFCSDHGHATHINFPYFNLEYGDCGVMLAIGWAGTWNADFYANGDKTTYNACAVPNLKSVLRPGEKVRSASFLMAEYKMRDEDFATNYWRSFYIAHILPKEADGSPIKPFSTCCLAYDTGLPHSDGSISEHYYTWKPSLEKMIEEDCKVDFRWVDAGWYIRPDLGSATPIDLAKHLEDVNKRPEGHEKDWWCSTGTWEFDPKKWPDKTFLESTEFARANGMKTLLWFEPERVNDVENLEKNFGYNPKWAIHNEEILKGPWGAPIFVNNLGDDDCYRWTLDRILKTLKENKIDMYREDNNKAAAKLWTYLDNLEGENRNGITECKLIQRRYEMWDTIIECTTSYGGCSFVDSCCAGGGRNDYESLKRGIPLLRSDSDRRLVAHRLAMTTSFNKWIPFCGANTREKLYPHLKHGDSDRYIFRASYLSVLNVDSQFVYNPDPKNFEILREGLKEWKKVAPYILKDFYVHTPWHQQTDTTAFTAFSFVDPESEKGVILAFSQEKCERQKLNISLPYAESGKMYKITDEDTGMEEILSGDSLSYEYTIKFKDKREARLLWIESVK